MSAKPVKQHAIRPSHARAALEAITASETDVLVYTMDEVARILKVSKKTIQNLIKADKLIAVRILGAVRIPRSEIDRLARLGTTANPEEQETQYERVDATALAAVKEKIERSAKRPDLRELLTQRKGEN